MTTNSAITNLPGFHPPDVCELAAWVRDVLDRTLELVADLNDEQLMGPRLAIVNPLLWEIGHTAWFTEKWVLRHACREKPIRGDADSLYDSIAIPHDTRWDLPLPTREETLRYMTQVRDRVLDKLSKPHPAPEFLYHVMYSVFHGDMHNEAFTYTRQTLGYAAPRIAVPRADDAVIAPDPTRISGDVEIPGGEFLLGASLQEPFVFDNEKWTHPVQLRPFAISRTAVTQGEFLAFVEDGGYNREDLWSPEGWLWRQQSGASHPLYWDECSPGRWFRRSFDQLTPIEPNMAMIHVNWYEADAYCRWAKRRLPSESEWEAAAAGVPERDAVNLSRNKRRYPWGERTAAAGEANLDWIARGVVDVSAFPKGDTIFGCRQMIGNVWEWTATPFVPYPGFVPDPYQEYSEPWFDTHKVLRGGCWATRSRFIHNTYRNFYMPDRRDVWAGFRTCRPLE
ncbi:MAG: ergothioneine biosynthesis protein EgtB [Acidobacteria bacterium]|nr:ergothioneine biosynthesis protein EgtB [Acidobacteriota bacterium]